MGGVITTSTKTEGTENGGCNEVQLFKKGKREANIDEYRTVEVQIMVMLYRCNSIYVKFIKWLSIGEHETTQL